MISISCCGYVTAHNDGRIKVKIQKERCASCAGNCAQIKFNGELHLEGEFDVGDELRITSSVFALSLASLTVFGFPVLLLVIATLYSENPLWITAGLVVGLLLSAATIKLKFFETILKPQISRIHSAQAHS